MTREDIFKAIADELERQRDESDGLVWVSPGAGLESLNLDGDFDIEKLADAIVCILK